MGKSYAVRTLRVAAVVLLAVASASAGVQYKMTDLGTLGGSSSAASGVNSSGCVVGWYTGSDSIRAFVYRPGVGMTDLGSLGGNQVYARGINEYGQVTGVSSASNGFTHAFLYTPESGMLDLGSLNGENGSSNGYGLNASGQVVGDSMLSPLPGPSRAMIYTPGVGMVDIGTLGAASYGTAINAVGRAAGYSWVTSAKNYHAFVYTPGSGMTDIGTLGGSYSYAHGINDLGQVVGRCVMGFNYERAFIWEAGHGMTQIGTLGGDYSQALAINNAGQIVGGATVKTGEYHAFVYTAGSGMTDLGTLPGGTKSFANALSPSGLIAGYSYVDATNRHAVLWEPVPEPESLLVFGSGCAGILLLRRRKD